MQRGLEGWGGGGIRKTAWLWRQHSSRINAMGRLSRSAVGGGPKQERHIGTANSGNY